jgi:hypothetical protein
MADEQIELVELDHFIKSGSMTIGETTYPIVKGKVKVSPDDAVEARKHIKMGG